MPLESAELPPGDGYDVHLIPGMSSPRFDQLIFLRYSVPGGGSTIVTLANREADTAVVFAPRFAGLPEDHGLTVDPLTGRVDMATTRPTPPPPDEPRPRLPSFILTARVTDPGLREPVSFRIRIHLHPALEELRLSPPVLTVRAQSQHTRFSVLARFSDGVIGDVSNWSPTVTRKIGEETFAGLTGTMTPFLTWSGSSSFALDVMPDSGHLTGIADGGTSTVTVTAGSGPVPPAGWVATGQVESATPWSTPTDIRPLDGHSSAATAATRANVLFLPDGFSEGEREAFEKLAAGIVDRLRRRRAVRPFDLLSDRMNFFSAWVPSRDRGISVLNEMSRGQITAAVPVSVQDVPLPEPVNGSGDWSLANLVDEVGLPVPNADAPGSSLGDPAFGRLQIWQTLYGKHITAEKVTNLHDRWLALSDRALAEEKDTAFHTVFSKRPTLSGAVSRSMTPHIRRLHVSDLDAFFGALRDPDGATVPVWGTGGADAGNVVILCRSQRWGGTNNGQVIACSLGDEPRHRLAGPAGAPAVVEPDPIPDTASIEVWTTVAHELGHSWNLADEYAGRRTVVAAQLVRAGNVQHRSTLLNAGGAIDAAGIRWGHWPRIERAGVVSSAAVPQGGGFRIGLEPEFTVRKKDVIRLRTRPLPTSRTSGRWLVVDTSATSIDVEPLDGADPATVATFTPEDRSIVIVPVRDDDPDANAHQYGDDLMLVDPGVLAWIAEHHQPLNAARNSPANRKWAAEGINQFTPTPARNIPRSALRFPPEHKSWIVGLFEEGADAERDVYRPTGTCAMRRDRVPQRGFLGSVVPERRRHPVQFCTVCRYVMVDRLDPLQHGAIERDYPNRS